ncbi:MAG: hypothetical protein JXB85_09685 [Anaerolineales bacterium]|nr:hypothetical protein [Anaerolineales bacterium]
MNKNENPPDRPLGLWLVTLWNGLAAGLAPLVLTLMVFFDSAERSTQKPSWAGSLASLLLAVMILAAAVFTWRGKNPGRVALIGLIGLHYGLLAIRYFGLLAGPDSFDWTALWRGLRAVLWIIINTWYLGSKRIRTFFARS